MPVRQKAFTNLIITQQDAFYKDLLTPLYDCVIWSSTLNTDRQEEARRFPISGPSKYKSVVLFRLLLV
jgi:hypothetical protein